MIEDKGSWHVIKTQPNISSKVVEIFVCSEDFNHDVSLKILGDFADFHDKWEYAQWLAKKLNS